MPILTVLVGAGASFDCARIMTATNPDWRPPLVNDLFNSRPSFADILRKYPKAEAMAEEIRIALDPARAGGGMTLERFLKAASTDAADSVRKRYRQVPLYLQEMIGEVSEHYIRYGTSMFSPFVADIDRSLVGRFERVIYLTTNYDLFLDKALTTHYDHPFATMSDYISNPKWSLIKLHGSVDWARPLTDTDGASSDIVRHLRILAAMTKEPHEIESEIEQMGAHQDRMRGGKFMYPALAIPVEGKSGLVCPDTHATAAMTRVADSSHFLIVGCRVADEDVLDLFSRVKKVESLMVVSKPVEDAQDTIDRLATRNSAFVGVAHYTSCQYGDGFSRFISDGVLRAFLERRGS